MEVRRLRRRVMRSTFFLVCVIRLLVGCAVQAQTVYVPMTHWVYEYLEKMESRGHVSSVLAGTKPLSRAEIGRYISQINASRTRGAQLNRVERDQLEYLKFEFREELASPLNEERPYTSRLSKVTRIKPIDRLLPDSIYRNGRNLFSYTAHDFRFYWDPIFARIREWADADTLAAREQIFTNSNGFVLWGSVGAHLGFFCDVRDSKEWGTRPYPDAFNVSAEGLGFVNGYGDHIYHDETVAYLTVEIPHFVIQYGKDCNQWGPGYRGALSLSNEATSYDLVKLQVLFSSFKFTSMIGFLRHYPIDLMSDDRFDKSLAAHRLEFSPLAGLDIGLHETVIYSGRKIEPAYLNPVMFFRSADHYLGDRDNVGMGADVELLLLPRTKLYAELFIDDITTTKLGTGYHGNRTAYTLGALHVDLIGIDNLDCRVEYTRIRPFVYSHRDSLNLYRHFTTTLGHRAGPNADALFFGLSYRPHWRLKVECVYEAWRHGANLPGKNVGGDISVPHGSWDPSYLDFLDGLRSCTRGGRVEARYELAHHICLRGAAGKFWGSTETWPAGARGTISRSEIAFTISVNL